MPAKLKEPTEFVKWRIRVSDLELLRLIAGDGEVNSFVRGLLAAYCDRLRAKSGLGTPPGDHPA